MARSWLTVAAKAAITIALIAWLVHRIEIGPAFDRLVAIDIGYALAACLAMAVQLLLAGWRWGVLGDAIGAPPRRGTIIRLTFIGQFFNQTLPSAIGGDAVRAWMAAREGLPMGRAVSGVVADRVVGLVVLLLISAATLPLFTARVADPLARAGVFAAVLGALSALALFCIFAKPVAARLQNIHLARPFATLALDLRHVLIGARQSPAIVGLAVIVHLLVIAAAYFLARGLGLQVSYTDCLIFVPLVVFLTMLPISIAGWGVREAAMVAAFAYVGVDAAGALALSVAFGLVQIIVGLPGGLWWLKGGSTLPPPVKNDGAA
jgi:glycosyltransferase 2 family protein